MAGRFVAGHFVEGRFVGVPIYLVYKTDDLLCVATAVQLDLDCFYVANFNSADLQTVGLELLKVCEFVSRNDG